MMNGFYLPDGVPALYEELHRFPELSGSERFTSSLCADRLASLGFSVNDRIGGYGVVAERKMGHGPTVVVRAELDALPLQEQTAAPFASKMEGVMHACGHDLHLAALLAAVEQICSSPSLFNGRLVTVLQPAEEDGTGANSMVDQGLLEIVGEPDILLTQHVSPLAPVGVLASTPGVALAASRTYRIRVGGEGSHSSANVDGLDPVTFVCGLTNRLASAVPRRVAPFDQAILSIPSILAPSTSGLRAPVAELLVNVRAFYPHVLEALEAEIFRIVSSEAHAAGLSVDLNDGIEVDLVGDVPCVENDKDWTNAIFKAQERRLSLAHVSVPPALASDDFSILSTALGCPSVYWFVGSGAPGGALGDLTRPRCHTAHYLPDPKTLATATAALREAIVFASYRLTKRNFNQDPETC